MALYTVLGARGFVGSSLVRHLVASGHRCQPVARQDPIPSELGHVVYCIGSPDFRTRPHDTIDAHVSVLSSFLQSEKFESFTYLSSTRVYLRLPPDGVAHEDSKIIVDPHDPYDIYNLTKLAGECLCLMQENPTVRVVRLSNVYGGEDVSDNFLTTILRQVLTRGAATFFVTMSSFKDYVDVRDVVRALELIPLRASNRLVNLAAGRNVTNQEIADLIKRETGCTVGVKPGAEDIRFPRIAIDRLIQETGLQPRDLADQFSALVNDSRAALARRAAWKRN